MPSVFNHDNSCWGVKKSFCDFFQYELQEAQNSKSPEHEEKDKISSSPVNNSFQYSVSSNGYYGYQPHSRPDNTINNVTVCDCSNDDFAMDIEDNSNVCQSVTAGNNFMINFNLDSTRIQSYNRKRHFPDKFENVTKRKRQEGKPNCIFHSIIY